MSLALDQWMMKPPWSCSLHILLPFSCTFFYTISQHYICSADVSLDMANGAKRKAALKVCACIYHIGLCILKNMLRILDILCSVCERYCFVEAALQ